MLDSFTFDNGSSRFAETLANWDAIAAISAVIGAVAVVISLLFVAYELRRNTAVQRTEIFRNFRAEVANWQMAMGSNEAMASLIVRTFHQGRRRKELSDVEAVQMGNACLSLLNLYESCFLAGREGTLSGQDVERIISSSRLWNIPFVRDSWPLWRTELGQEFVNYFEGKYPALGNLPSVHLTNGVAAPARRPEVESEETSDEQAE